MKVRPVGHMISVLVDSVEKKTEAGIILMDEQTNAEQNASVIGTVTALGPNAYADYPSPWCEVGDRVMIARYGGMLVRNVHDQEEDIRILNDDEIVGIVEEEE